VCNTKISYSLNGTALMGMIFCTNNYTSFSLKYLIDLLSNGIYCMFNHVMNTFTFMLIILIVYSIINKNSDAASTLSQVFNVLHQDIKTTIYKIRSRCIITIQHLSLTINIVKLIELIIIGLFVVCISEVVTFVLKTFSKLGKI